MHGSFLIFCISYSTAVERFKTDFLKFYGFYSLYVSNFWIKLHQHKITLSNWFLLFLSILISCELKLCFFSRFKFVENHPFSYENSLWNNIFWKELFCDQFLASWKEEYSIVDSMTSPVAISIVGQLSRCSCFDCCHSVQNVYAFNFNGHITQKVVT